MHPSFTCHKRLCIAIITGSAVLSAHTGTSQVQSAATQHETSTAFAHPITGTPPPRPTSPMPLVAPVFLQTDQIDSTITVVNGIIYAVDGTITLRDQQGKVIGQQTITFPAHSSTPVAMKAILQTTGSQAHSGSVTLLQDAAVKGPALLPSSR